LLVAVAGISYKTTPVEIREKVAFPVCAGRSFLRRIREEGLVSEAVLLSTCNRTELYAVLDDEGMRAPLLAAISEDRGVQLATLERESYWLTDEEAVEHLYRVASSLDSMVVGEAQILGQVREAYRVATEEKATGHITNRLFHTALRIGKRVRAQTGIGDGSVSVPHVAAKLAEEVFGGLRGRRALVIGAGDMSELVVKHLRSRGIGEVRIANRTPERARLLADRLEGVAVGFENIGRELAAADVVVSSTGSGEWVVRLEEVGRAVERRTAPLFFVDIAVPRDVDPRVQSLRGVHLYDIDDLQAVVERNACDRKAAAEAGEAMISPAVMEFMSWLSTLDVVPVIKEMRDEAEGIRRHELARALKRLDLSPEEEQVLEKMTHAIVNKLLHGPIQEVKSRASSPLQSPEVRRRLWEREGFEVELHGPKRG